MMMGANTVSIAPNKSKTGTAPDRVSGAVVNESSAGEGTRTKIRVKMSFRDDGDLSLHHHDYHLDNDVATMNLPDE